MSYSNNMQRFRGQFVSGRMFSAMVSINAMQTCSLAIHSPRNYTIDNFVAAMSSASTSAVNRAKAFFDPSGLQPSSAVCRQSCR